MSEGNKPEKKFRAGAVTGTVWENKGKKDDKEFSFYTTDIVRNYKDKDDKWQKTSNFRKQDLPDVRLIAGKLYEYLSFKEEATEKKE